MLFLECEIRRLEGMRAADVVAVVSDFSGRKEQLQIERDFLVQRSGRTFLPVWGVAEDRKRKLVELELPLEAMSGTNRIWVEPEKLFTSEVPA